MDLIKRIEIYAAIAVIVVLTVSTGWFWAKATHLETALAKSEATVEKMNAAVQEQERKTAQAKLDSERNFNATVAALTSSLNTLNASNVSLRNSLASNRSLLPPVPAGTKATDGSICFDRAELDRAVSDFRAGVSGIAQKGAAATVTRDGWHLWYDGQMKGQPSILPEPAPAKKWWQF